MKTAFIIHGSYDAPDCDWYPWLKGELEKSGYTVYVPTFPTPEHQSLLSWMSVFEQYIKNVTSETIFIGHGAGCAFILRIIEKLETPIKAVFFVTPFIEELPHQGLNLVNVTFFSTEFSWKNIHERVHDGIIFASNDDPYVPLELSQHVADLLGFPLIMLEGRGHFSGVSTFDEVLASIKEIDITPEESEARAVDILDKELLATGITVPSHEKQTQNFHDAQDTQQTQGEQQTQNEHSVYDEDTTKPKSVNTYYGDIVGALNTTDTMAMASVLRTERENKKKEALKRRHHMYNFIFGVLSIVLIVAGIIILVKTKQPVANLDEEMSSQYPSLIRIDEQVGLLLTGSSVFSLSEKLSKVLEEHKPDLHSITHIVPFDKVGGSDNIPQLRRLFSSFEVTAPEELISSVEQLYVYGWYGGSLPHTFLLLEIKSFDGAFSGMNLWEKTMIRDLKSMFMIDESFLQPSVYDTKFVDIETNNYKLRILRAPSQTRIDTKTTIEHVLPDPPKQHFLSQDVLSGIMTISNDAIVFSTPTPFLASLAEGDIIIGTPVGNSNGFFRSITGFSLSDKHLVIHTRQVSASDALPTLPDGALLQKRFDKDGKLEYYYTTDQIVPTYTSGPEVTILGYTFINNRYLLIMANEDVLQEVVERLSETPVIAVSSNN
ncbi:hypothetical protein A2997_00015 [Candidatus Nomurabacteria bacterium RIFCSPLOWO2_01_FULL_36_10b]|uniref:Uncharacterized protein n=1 Tax=Candidatus Nomurabacteria bacterium RIFCSPLOWO2_01_FULL_36_10b TaxID=1801766 RepID=A0A1F6WPY6_9BACT|nr:MAG: hypothetical protein A2997_00015 [Candidatus Nomurabacteria bacterium RIFCSPLOWO2_01_FULL_36_10b]